MLLLLSPSKTLDFSTPAIGSTVPKLIKETAVLVAQMRTFSVADLMVLMKISAPIAELTAQRFREWQPEPLPQNGAPAIFAFSGEAYAAMQPSAWSAAELDFANKNLRLLSGLYGVLRPLDLLQGYRLEMATPLPNLRGNNLYAFWKMAITEAINADLEATNTDLILNLASDEYFKAVDTKKIRAKIIDITFKERRGDAYKVISFNAKRARGKMTDFVVRNRISVPQDLHRFTADDYHFSADLSTSEHFVFIRNASAINADTIRR